MKTSQLLAALVAVSAASATVFDDMKAVADVGRMIVARQDQSGSSSPSATAAPKSDESKSAQETASATQKDDASGSAKITDSAKATGTGKDSGSSGGGNRTQTFDARLPAGGISMITPSALAGSQYFKIGDWVTLAWNYTSLSVRPTAVDVLASCSANQGTYTLAVNQTVAQAGEAKNTILWDTGAYQATGTLPLLTETYTLIVYDADSSISATAQAGYLGTSNQFTFGMYSPQPYTPWTDYKCPTCINNGAMSAYERSVLKILFYTGGTTIASLLYFAWTFGIF